MSKQAKAETEEATKSELPPEDMYELCIQEVQEKEDVKQFLGGVKDEIVLVAELLGTKNPDYEDEPFRVFIWGCRDTKKLLTRIKGVDKPSNAYSLLVAAGFKPDPRASFKSVNWSALEGCYLRGFVGHTADGQYLKLKPGDIKPLTNKTHIAANQERAGELFGKSS